MPNQSKKVMMHLSTLIDQLRMGTIDGNGNVDICQLSCDSREGQAGNLFVALSGFKSNGADFIKDVIAKGAVAIAKAGVSRTIGDYHIPLNIPVVAVDDPALFLRRAATVFYGNPSTQVKCIAITGTNGKTTISYLLESILKAASQLAGVVGTINSRVGDQIFPAKNTTPGFLDNQRFLVKLKEQKVGWCVMETSSHALSQGRVDGIDFAAGVFTNLTQDHLDYHKDMASYFNAKALLFENLPSNAVAVINSDDAYGQQMTKRTKAKVFTYAVDQYASMRAKEINYGLDGTSMVLHASGTNIPVKTRFIGKHNVYNILAAAGCALELGFTVDHIKKGIEACRAVPGRLEPVDCGQPFFVFIDYAHTDDGLKNVLQALRAVSDKRIITGLGCGGDRDRGKRPKMGKIVAELSDYAIVTSDNPRSEEPGAIIDDIVGGMQGASYEICLDRREAIGRALALAQPGEMILIAGKGHEDYQILKDKTIPFNEREIVREYISKY